MTLLFGNLAQSFIDFATALVRSYYFLKHPDWYSCLSSSSFRSNQMIPQRLPPVVQSSDVLQHEMRSGFR